MHVFVQNAALYPSFSKHTTVCAFNCVCLQCMCASVCACVFYGHRGRGPHYLAGSLTNMATARWGQLANLFLFPELFNELVMGRTAQLS